MSFVSLRSVRLPIVWFSLFRFLKNWTKCAILIWKECEIMDGREWEAEIQCQRNSSFNQVQQAGKHWEQRKRKYDGFGSKIYDSVDWIELILNEILLDFIFSLKNPFFHKNAKHAVQMVVCWHWSNRMNRSDIAFPSDPNNKINKLHIS